MRHTTQSFILLSLAVVSNTLAAITPVNQESMPPKGLEAQSGHSQCYNYFLEKDQCVAAAEDPKERCQLDSCGREVPSHLPMVIKSQKHSQQSTWAMQANKKGIEVISSQQESYESTEVNVPGHLARRYDSEEDSFTVAGGSGICGSYTVDQPGVCLWAPLNPTHKGPNGAGWLNGNFSKACGRQIYIQRKGDPSSVVYAPVIDGCDFQNTEPEPGCFRIAFTQATFDALKPTDKEKEKMKMEDLIWDFDNLHGDKPENAAV